VSTIGRAQRTTEPFAGYEFEYETFGDPSHPALLLVMGLGAQMVFWPEGLIDQLVDARFFVIRFDNRDCGKSTYTDGDAPTTGDFLKARFTKSPIGAKYLLSDMADDAFAVLDHLQIERAHIVGASMGGMIVQSMAIAHPDRVLTMTSIMSTTGNLRVGQASLSFMAKFAPILRRNDPSRAVESGVDVAELTAGLKFDREAAKERAERALSRGYHPVGRMWQTAAIMASGDRTEGLRALTVPSLVIHGRRDPLVPISGGAATAAAIPGCRYVVFDDMGHDLPAHHWTQVVAEIADLALVASRANR
jgi:pimeloyl-ACP methyl ester carboxylesterase